MDDIIINGNNSSLLRWFIDRTHLEFAIKNLGQLNYFLNLEVSYTNNGLFVGQTKYAHDILDRVKLVDSKLIATPLVPRESLVSSGAPFKDPTLYKSIVGALQYLTITHLDLSYAANQVSQFLHSPTVDHFVVVKQILRYVKGTLHFGLSFACAQSLVLLAILMLTGHAVWKYVVTHMVILSFWGVILFHGALRNNSLFHDRVVNLSIALWPILLLNLSG